MLDHITVFLPPMEKGEDYSSRFELVPISQQYRNCRSSSSSTMLESSSPGRPGILARVWDKLSCWFHTPSPEEEEIDLLQQQRIRELPLFLAAKENKHVTIKNWLAHKSFDFFERGAVGETALHVAALYDNLEAVCALLDAALNLINEPMTSELYAGQTALHIAVVNQNLNLVKELVGRGADVSSPRATGTFFKRRPQNLIYFGEHVLSFAACMGHEEIVRFLIEKGANIKAQDSLGNTVLHILVMQPAKAISCQMHDLILSYDTGASGPPLDEIQNNEGLTPFKLAAIEGNTGMFQHMLQKRKQVRLFFGPMTSTLYDLSGIDSWGDDKSVLELVTSMGNQKARRTLSLSPVKELVSLKWNNYKGSYFCASAISYVLYMCCFTLCCVYRPMKPRTPAENSNDPDEFTQETLQESYVTLSDDLRLVGEIISVTGAIAILLFQIADILHSGCRRFFRQTIWAEPFNLIIISYAVLVLVILVMRVTSTDEERIPMSLALILGWCYIMYFSRGLKMLGPFTIMIQKMAIGDLLRFCWLVAVVIVGYGTALYVTLQTVDPMALGSFNGYKTSLYSTYELFLNILNGPANYTVDVPFMYCPLYSSFCVIAFLLMFNLLIATLGETQSRLAKEKDELWRVQITTAATMVEHRLPQCFWLRSGIPGKEYGLEDRWYLNVEDQNDHTKPRLHPIEDQDKEDSEDSCAETETPEQIGYQLQDTDRISPEPICIKPCQGKSASKWQVIRAETISQLQGTSVNCTGEDEEKIHHV